MDYIGYKCQVCDNEFVKGDDIVVCPECGTPHHRECYSNLGHCVNESKHSQGYDYLADIEKQKEDNITEESELITCKVCGAKNPNDAFFCSRCGEAFQKNTATDDTNNQTTNNTQQPQPPFTSMPGAPNIIMLDPLAGVKPDADLGDGVTVAEAAKFVRQNTPYFATVFNNIKTFAKSRFNFCAAIFGGGYLLYRKMYKIGTIITVIEAMIMIASTYLAHFISTDPVFSQLISLYSAQDYNGVMSKLATFSSLETFVLFFYPFLSFLSLAISIAVGFLANRMYFNHCKREIVKIKKSVEKPEDVDIALKLKGGVNMGLALSLWISYIAISYLPRFFY